MNDGPAPEIGAAPPVFKVKDIVRQVFKNSPVSFVQIGSNDGKTGDPLFKTATQNDGWTGILIEPVPYLYGRLRQNYGDSTRFIFENVAIGRASGTQPFYYVSPQAAAELTDVPVRYDQVGSFDKGHILKHFDGRLEPFIQTIEVEVCTLPQILARHGWDQIDLLHIDAEGYDWEILSELNLADIGAKMVIFEYKHLSSQAKKDALDKMTQGGYRTIELANDICAIRR